MERSDKYLSPAPEIETYILMERAMTRAIRVNEYHRHSARQRLLCTYATSGQMAGASAAQWLTDQNRYITGLEDDLH